MKKEIEARYLNCNVQDIIKKLQNNNATFVGDWLQLRYCYDFTPVRENMWIRLRTNGVETTLTIKQVESKSVDGTKECEIVVSDFQTTNELLQILGYYPRSEQENRRIRYILDDVEIDIDFWPLIDPFLEFEAKRPEDIKKVCKKLDINFEDLVTLDVESIYLQCGYKSDTLDHIKLEEYTKNKKYIQE